MKNTHSTTFLDFFNSDGRAMILFDPDSGKTINANKSALNYYGYSLETITNMYVYEINTLSKEQIHIEMQNAMKEKRNHFYFKHLLANGEIRDVEVYSSALVIDGKKLLLSNVYDITRRKKVEKENQLLNLQLEQKIFDKTLELQKINENLENKVEAGIAEIKKSEKELEKSYTLLHKLTENIPGAIYQFRLYPDGRMTFPYASGGIQTIWEVTLEDIINDATPALSRIHPDDTDMLITSIEDSAKTMKVWDLEYRHNLPKKGLSWLHGQAKPEKLEDGSILWHGYVYDITEIKKKDEMLINQSRHAAMGEMISMIAHQWRQPLSNIAMDANNMLLDIALDNFNISSSKEYANHITTQTQNLSKTIDDFRNFFKPDKMISKVNIKEILNQTLSIVQSSLKNHSIELTSSFETTKEVNAYPRELIQVFVNIITNSKDVIKSNKIENAKINIRVYEDEKYLNTEISDNGGGIDANVLPKVFDPYFSTKEERTGTGLGLYMSKMIIVDHLHGLIEVNNNDYGACFTIRLLK